MRNRRRSIETPWGPSQSDERIAEGVVRLSTSSHGGYSVSPESLATMPEGLRLIVPFAGEGWYEEDADWSIVALAWPDLFTPRAVHGAVRTAKAGARMGSRAQVQSLAWLESESGAHVRGIAERWERLMGEGRMYEPGSMGTSGSDWRVCFNPIGHDGPRLVANIAEYPELMYSESDLLARGAVAA